MCGIIASTLIAWLFALLGKFDLARPALYSMAMLGVAVAVKWKLRGHVWFWITIAAVASLHLLLVLLVPWGTKWVPAIVIIPIGIADLYAMLWLFSFIGKFMKHPETTER